MALAKRPKPVLTEELIEEVSGLISDGHYPKVVAITSGLSVHQFNKWMDAGRDLWTQRESGVEAAGRVFSDEEELLMDFTDHVDLAFATAEMMMVNWMKELAKAGKSTWTMPMTWLERCRPGWQRRDQTLGTERSVDEELVKLSAQFEQFDKKRQRSTG